MHTCCDNRRCWSNTVGHLEREEERLALPSLWISFSCSLCYLPPVLSLDVTLQPTHSPNPCLSVFLSHLPVWPFDPHSFPLSLVQFLFLSKTVIQCPAFPLLPSFLAVLQSHLPLSLYISFQHYTRERSGIEEEHTNASILLSLWFPPWQSYHKS